MRFQIRTLQVPKRGAGAFTPTLTPIGTAATAGQNQARIYAMMGQTPVAAPRPPALNDSSLGGPYNQPSAVSPDYILPGRHWYCPTVAMRFPGKLLSDNVLPVPAGNPGRVTRPWAFQQRIGGRIATASVRPFTTWPSYGGR